ncbi:hypothetical protein HAX54_051163 [Datura stramonium]|uniref:Membrane protein insertion efficiency factor n=1 Tax=Datura stramonium TaxID=4076 RepID=A0ABS8SY94_DATST|nr:hypothetical protein [Datura stramonium]
MALALSLNWKPFSPTNSTFSFPSSSPYKKQQANLLFPLRKKYRKQSRSLCIVSGSDSGESNSQDDKVDNLGVKAALSMLKFYKREISPIMPKSCRYIPTCSEYSMIAYKKYGVVKGTVLTAWRLCRCNPLGITLNTPLNRNTGSAQTCEQKTVNDEDSYRMQVFGVLGGAVLSIRVANLNQTAADHI